MEPGVLGAPGPVLGSAGLSRCPVVLGGMLAKEDGSLYLEPGEVAALASALRGAGRRPVEHPEDVLFAAVADALEAMAAGAGVACAPTREAALGFVSPGAAYWVPVRWPPGSGASDAL